MDNLEQLVRTYVHLPQNASGTGWFTILCKVCNDHGKKGPRGGFRFDDGIAYHCFNCGHKARYSSNYKNIPDDMMKVFISFGVPDEEINKLRLAALHERDEGGHSSGTQKDRGLTINPKELPLPDHFYRLDQADQNDKWAEIARYYLEDRKFSPSDYPFYLSTGIPQQYPESQKRTFLRAAQKWVKRIIIPIYKDGKLVYYQGRDLTNQAVKKYESPSAPKERVIYGFDELFSDETRPLYVTEGFFDAFHIKGVALLGNELTEPQIVWLNKSRRDKVYIPDRGASGAKIARRALELGWKISFPVEPDSSTNCKDVNEAIIKYGQLYVHRTLKEQTQQGVQAEASINLYCKKANDQKRGPRNNS